MAPLERWDPFEGMTEHFDLQERQIMLRTLPVLEGEWSETAGFFRLGMDRMSQPMFRRFFKGVEKHDMGHFSPCWIWTKGTASQYGRFWVGWDMDDGSKVVAQAHRVTFEHFIGKIPFGYVLDHKCEIKLCVNPTHTWPMSNNDNLRLADKLHPWKRRNQYSQE